ncbi:MAG: hypothetical protein M1820_001731 [Bogoriella megaspora]|nr:MAG: hypothetical protein M1820_001731 [Bogoriella megaspora]
MYKRENIGEVDRGRVEIIKTALRLGYRHIDTAHMYQTELEVGVAVRECGIPREDLFVTTKYNPKYGEDLYSALGSSLNKLQLEYVDLFLLHSPYWTESETDLQKVWEAMESIKASGKARSIGVSNYELSHLKSTLATAKVTPSINQIELHPYMQHEELLDFSHKNGIATSAYGTLAPLTRNRPGSLDEVLVQLGTKYSVSPGLVCLRWCVQLGITPVTTSYKEQRLAEYAEVFGFSLNNEDVKTISVQGKRSVEGVEVEPRVLQYARHLKSLEKQ